jgi:hypothetical protein
MINRRSQGEALLNSVNFAGASAWCWNHSTQIGARTSTTAICARSLAIRSAVPPSVHPKTEKPSTDMATAPITTPQIPDFKLGGNFMDLMSCAPVSAPPLVYHTCYPIPEISALLVRGAIRTTTYAKAGECGIKTFSDIMIPLPPYASIARRSHRLHPPGPGAAPDTIHTGRCTRRQKCRGSDRHCAVSVIRFEGNAETAFNMILEARP